MKDVTFKQAMKIGAGLTAGAALVYAVAGLMLGLAQMLAMYMLS